MWLRGGVRLLGLLFVLVRFLPWVWIELGWGPVWVELGVVMQDRVADRLR